MTYVYLDPADYVVGKPISFEEYAQLVENANQAYGAGTNHGDVFATIASATGLNVSVSGSAGSYTFTVPSGITTMIMEAIGGGGGGGDDGTANQRGGGGPGAYEAPRAITVVPGETLTIAIGAGGLGGSSTAGQSGTATTVTGSTSGLIFSADYGRGGPMAAITSGAAGTPVRGKTGVTYNTGRGGDAVAPYDSSGGAGGAPGSPGTGYGSGGGGGTTGAGGNGAAGLFHVWW